MREIEQERERERERDMRESKTILISSWYFLQALIILLSSREWPSLSSRYVFTSLCTSRSSSPPTLFLPSHLTHSIPLFLQKRFYNRETNNATFCVIQQMSIKLPFLSQPMFMFKGGISSIMVKSLYPLLLL